MCASENTSMSDIPKCLKSYAPSELLVMYQLPSEGRYTATSDLPSPS
jgi:hypothetical protein